MKQKQEEDRSGLFIPAGIFIGMGLGFLATGLTRLIQGKKVFKKI